MILENWFVNKEFNAQEIEFYREGKVEKLEETEKAYKVKFIAFGSFIIKWIPKKVILHDGFESVKEVELDEIEEVDFNVKNKNGEIFHITGKQDNFYLADNGKKYYAPSMEII